MKIVTANIRNNPDMLRKKVKADAKTASRYGGVIFFQEIAEAEDHADVKAAIGDEFGYAHSGVAIPIAYRRDQWTLVDHGRIMTHGGKRLVSPNRYVTWVLLQSRDGKQVCFMNTHFVSGAWNAKRKLSKEWRQQMWQEHWLKMRGLIKTFADQNVTVIFGGDFNRYRVARLHPRARWAFDSGIDKVGYVQGAVKVYYEGHHSVELNSDHDAHVVSFMVK